jgi:hypothetical protein
MDGFISHIVVMRAVAFDRHGVRVKRKDADVPEHRENRDDDRDSANEMSRARSGWHRREAYGRREVMSIMAGADTLVAASSERLVSRIIRRRHHRLYGPASINPSTRPTHARGSA